MGVVVPHQLDGVARRDVVEFHEVGYFWISFDLLDGFCVPSPGGTVSRWFSSSSFPRISSMFGQVASLLVADETFSVSDMFHPIAWREIDFVYVHSVWVSLRVSASRRDVTVSSSSEFPESHHVSIEFPGLV